MSLKSFFNKISQKREARAKYKALIKAVDAGDMAGVRRAIADGADPGYTPSGGKKMALGHALRRDDGEIARELLKNPSAASSAAIFHYDFRRFNNTRDPSDQLYFATSFLFSAIELGKKNVALAIAQSPYVDVESAGEIVGGGGRSGSVAEQRKKLQAPLVLAREKGMPLVVKAIEARLQSVNARRAGSQITQLEEQAARKRAEAAELERQAEELRAKAGKPEEAKAEIKPAPAPGGFKL